MERGLIIEAEAVDWYEFDRDVLTQKVGFITDHDHTVGCSPDRLVGDHGLLEITAPPPHTRIGICFHSSGYRASRPGRSWSAVFIRRKSHTEGIDAAIFSAVSVGRLTSGFWAIMMSPT